MLPAGPTVVDAVANAAFYYGLVRTLAEQERPIWSQMSFHAAEENLHSGARARPRRHAVLAGPRPGPGRRAGAAPAAADGPRGPRRLGVDPATRDRLLSVIEGRCTTGVNGAAWQIGVVHDLQQAGADRAAALHGMLERYVPHMHSNEPVHTWPR